MLMKNSPRVDEDPLKKHGVVYRIICPADGCSHSYIGMTTTRLSKRLSVHLQEGNFHQHYNRIHGELPRTTLLQATSIIDQDSDRRRLRLKEALHIMRLKPTLNVTQETLLLPTNIRRNRPPTTRAPATVGAAVRAPEPTGAPADVPATQQPNEHQDGAPQGSSDQPAAPPRRSARIRHLAASANHNSAAQ